MAKKTNVKINGKNYYRITATVGKDADGVPIRKQFYGTCKKEAENARDAYMHNIKTGLSVSHEKLLFLSAYQQWFEVVHKPTLSLSSIIRYNGDNKRILNSSFAQMRLVDIKSLHIQQHYNELLKQGASVNMVRNIEKLLSPFFSYAIKTDLINKNPMLAVVTPKERKIEEEKRIFCKDDIKKLLDDCESNGKSFIFAFLVLTGLRQGEALALTHNDIDLTTNVVKVNKSMKYLTVNGMYQPIVSTTKTTNSTREVPLLSELRPLLIKHIHNEKEKHTYLDTPFTGDSILFSSNACGYIEGSNLRLRFKRLLKRLNIEQVTVHVLRHTFCSILAEYYI